MKPSLTILAGLASRHAMACQLHEGATRQELRELKRLLGVEVRALDPGLDALLRFSNGMQIGSYIFYGIFGEGINTISFRTLFLWELNDFWRRRLYLFMGFVGKAGLMDLGICRSFLGKQCVAAIFDVGYRRKELIPLASNVEEFLGAFAERCRQALKLDRAWNSTLRCLESWPPDLSTWYEGDVAFAKRLVACDEQRLRLEVGSYAPLIRESAQKALFRARRTRGRADEE